MIEKERMLYYVNDGTVSIYKKGMRKVYVFFFFKQKTAYEILIGLVGSEML